MEAFSDEDLQCLSRMFSNVDADYFMLQQFHDNGMAVENIPCFFSSTETIDDHNVAMAYESLLSNSDTNFNTNDSCPIFSQECSTSSGSPNVCFPNPSNIDGVKSMEFYVMDNKTGDHHTTAPFFTDKAAMDDVLNAKEEEMGNGEMRNTASGKQEQPKRKFDSPEASLSNGSSDNPKNKSRVSTDTQKIRKNTQPRKNKKNLQDPKTEDHQNETSGGQNTQSSSPSMSEDDSSASQELSGEANSESKEAAALNSNGKTRATRGSATDSQSLYARRRRERINERLRILQNLVPNGTKVDISTMLEEAVHYVKFLQLQIKLLSSDDLWMYASLAYSGMDMGVYQKMFPYL